MKTKNWTMNRPGRKLRFVRIAVDARTTPTQTLLLLKMNQELTYPRSHAAARSNRVKGNRSVLMPPVVAAVYHSPSLRQKS